ncbi:MAG: universal stress protein, partial [Dysgonamonadaceae bacterium]|nr:universal stress protein [Dysgonamonadaceae bacterium]
PEEEITACSKKHNPLAIIMGTRGKNQKDADLIGSVTAEVIEMSKSPVFAVPENTPFHSFSEIKHIAFGTSFEQKDLIAADALFKMFSGYNVDYHLFHISSRQDTWHEIKLAGIKDYFEKQYPDISVRYEVIDANDFVLNLEKFIRNNSIDIISLATHKRNLLARIINPSMARKMLFHTDTPILALRS